MKFNACCRFLFNGILPSASPALKCRDGFPLNPLIQRRCFYMLAAQVMFDVPCYGCPLLPRPYHRSIVNHSSHQIFFASCRFATILPLTDRTSAENKLLLEDDPKITSADNPDVTIGCGGSATRQATVLDWLQVPQEPARKIP